MQKTKSKQPQTISPELITVVSSNPRFHHIAAKSAAYGEANVATCASILLG